MSRESTLGKDISWFLATNSTISHLNYALKRRYKVYPSAYRRDVAYAFKGDKIQVKLKNLRQGVGATYNSNWLFGDTLLLPFGFNIANYQDQAFLIHECTHAHLDIQSIGSHSEHENESVAFVAEATFLEALQKPPLSKSPIRYLAQSIAKKILAGEYWIPDSDTDSLVKEIAKHPIYRKKTTLPSNGVWSAKSWFNPSK